MARVVIASSADADYADTLTDLATRAGWRTAGIYDVLFEKFYDHLADHEVDDIAQTARMCCRKHAQSENRRRMMGAM